MNFEAAKVNRGNEQNELEEGEWKWKSLRENEKQKKKKQSIQVQANIHLIPFMNRKPAHNKIFTTESPSSLSSPPSPGANQGNALSKMLLLLLLVSMAS